MKNSDELNVAQYIHCQAGSLSLERRIYLASKTEEDLVKNLRKEGILVIPEKSTRTVQQDGITENRLTVPLGTIFPSHSNYITVGYNLNGHNLNLLLSNYERLSRPPKGRLGGDISGELGIKCLVEITGEYNPKKTFENILSALKETYDGKMVNQMRKIVSDVNPIKIRKITAKKK